MNVIFFFDVGIISKKNFFFVFNIRFEFTGNKKKTNINNKKCKPPCVVLLCVFRVSIFFFFFLLNNNYTKKQTNLNKYTRRIKKPKEKKRVLFLKMSSLDIEKSRLPFIGLNLKYSMGILYIY